MMDLQLPAMPSYSKTLTRRRIPRVMIIGAGVIGMTCALQLLERGYRVTVVAKEFASPVNAQRLTSEIAGALWEWPPAVCGRHTDEDSLERAKVWCMDSYAKFVEMAMSAEETGVFVKQSVFYFRNRVEDIPFQLDKMNELSHLPGFQHDDGLIEQTAVNSACGVVDAYQHMAPMIDTAVFMQWLYKQCHKKGCRFVHDDIHGLLRDQAEELKIKYKAQLIVNCSGLSAKELAGDEDVYPSRGVILKVRNDGSLMPKLTHSMCISAINDKPHDSKQIDEDFVYILPRNDDKLWLGGLVQPNQWDRDLTLSYPPIRTMFDKVKEFYPPLRNYGDEEVEEVIVGLRPARKGDICLEWDPVSPSVLHNYGHGGSGVTFSWGCASEVCAMVDHALKRHKLIYVSRL